MAHSRKNRIIVTTLLVVCMCFLYSMGKGCTGSWKELAEREKTSNDKQLLTREAISQMTQKILVANLCTSGSLVLHCFDLNSSDCKDKAQAAAFACLSSQWPSATDSIAFDSAQKFIGKIGACTIDSIFKTRMREVKHTSECENPTAATLLESMFRKDAS